MAIRVNLVPFDILAKARQKQRVLQICLAGGAAALLIAAVSLGFVVRLKRLEGKLAAHEAKLKQLSAVVAKVKEAENIAGLLKTRLKVIDDLDRGRRAYPALMCDLTRSVPSGVRVQSLNTTGGGSTTMKLNIAAESRTNEDIALWVRRMEETGMFANIDLGPVTTKTAGDVVLRGFTLTAAYTPQL